MPFINNQGINLHYKTEGHGPAILCHHGVGTSMESWSKLDLSALKEQYQFIFIDSRGHGQSDKPHQDEAYDYRALLSDIIALLDHLHLDQIHYWGYSMGGKLGYALAQHHPERLQSLIIGGATSFDIPDSIAAAKRILPILEVGAEGGVAAVVEKRSAMGIITSKSYRAWLEESDLKSMAAIVRHRATNLLDFRDVLTAITVPCLIYAGHFDQPIHLMSEEEARRIPNSTFVSLPDLDHAGAEVAGDLILPEVMPFLKAFSCVDVDMKSEE
ncbi:MAG: alpha/beta hydrolase [Chloroflexota bacterium]